MQPRLHVYVQDGDLGHFYFLNMAHKGRIDQKILKVWLNIALFSIALDAYK